MPKLHEKQGATLPSKVLALSHNPILTLDDAPKKVQQMVFEDKFPGNKLAFERLIEAIKSGAIAFTGAGTSMPTVPSWGELTQKLLNEAKESSVITAEVHDALSREHDGLYVADQLSEAFGHQQFKNKVARIFDNLLQPTPAHTLIAEIAFRKYMTLNYDFGIEKAVAGRRSQHTPSITAKQRGELEKWMAAGVAKSMESVLHWHGATTHVEDIVLTGSDYSDFYEASAHNKENLRRIFRSGSVVMIGFGFQDQFITSHLESVMRVISSENKHFALIGVSQESFSEAVERRKFSTKYKMEPIFYPVERTPDGRSDHSKLLVVLEAAKMRFPAMKDADSLPATVADLQATDPSNYRANLFTVGEVEIYCEPNITAIHLGVGESDSEASISAIIDASGNICIAAPHEFGLTTLGRRISFELRKRGRACVIRDASSLPNYRKKLLQDSEIGRFASGEEFTLIVDNFAPVEHVRLLGELFSTFQGIRIVLLQRSLQNIGMDASYVNDHSFALFQLHGLRRGDIRTVANCFAPSQSEEQLSGVVEKIYEDLIQLCIPLTPSNIIMYCGVLYKDGDFSPVSRLQIVDRFIGGSLQRASDSYVDSFNFTNKVDLISHFCFSLFCLSKATFLQKDWVDFCARYKSETLMDFSEREILSDLISGGIVKAEGQNYAFRYKMFFSYFVGKHISARPAIMQDVIQKNQHLALDGLVEVLCGTSTDSTEVILDLAAKLEAALEAFYVEFPISGICYHSSVSWEFTDSDHEMWESVSATIDEGPLPAAKLDRLKTSIVSERRTLSQQVEIVKFVTFEKNVSMISSHLEKALESATYARGPAKIRATEAVLANFKLAYEVASILAPMIAERKYVSWNGFAYINLIQDSEVSVDKEKMNRRMLGLVVSALPKSISRSAVDRFGSRKLGPVFLEIQKQPHVGFFNFLLFGLILRSRPVGWATAVNEMISGTRRDDLFLRHMLGSTVRQYRNEVNSSNDRQKLKQVVAAISLRRDVGVKAPSGATLKKAVEKIEKSGMLDRNEAGD